MRKFAILIVGALLAACTADRSTPTINANATHDPSAAPPPTTAMAENATATPEPGFTLLPSTPILPTDTPTPCTNDAVFLADLTIPDNSEVVPGAPIDKRWKVQNTGTCHWNRDYRLAFFEGNQMGGASEHAVYPAKAGTEATLQINLIAPDVPGEYTGRWQLRNPEGQPFGQVLFIKIVVIQLASPSPTP